MNLVEISLSFFEGLALIASPCILPVLPLVLAGSVDGGRQRPFGIIVGFVGAFTLFTLLSRQLVIALHLDLDYIKYASLLCLSLFGFILLSEKLSLLFNRLTHRIANIGGRLSVKAEEGFISGLFIGLFIGLVWTPCAGPILATVLVQVIRQQDDFQALFFIASFGLGAALPMLIIALVGKKVIEKLGFFIRYAITMRRIFGLIILLTVLLIACGIDVQSLQTKKDKPIVSTQTGLMNALTKPYNAPEFSSNTWLNSQPLTMAGLRGKVVLVDFWTYSCINCLRTLPFIVDWAHKYHDKGLVIIGVHAPEFEFEKNSTNVQKAMVRHKISYPVVLDNNLDTWTNFNNKYWPAHYLINREGQVVYTHFGEGDYDITETNIRVLLGLNKLIIPTNTVINQIEQTPETYLGGARQDHFSDKFENLAPNYWGLSGKWRVEEQRIIAKEAGARLRLNFKAGKVFLVMGTLNDKKVDITISLDSKPIGNITVTQHKLYTLINQQGLKQGLLELKTNEPGLEAYAFTFGE